MKSLTVLLLFALSVATYAETEFFNQGKTRWKIGISPDATAVEKYAAEELKNTLKKISGADFPVIAVDANPAKGTILIGTPGTADFIKKQAEKLQISDGKTEEITVRTMDGNLYLAGNQPRAALYAVYSFLQNQLDVRWFWPGDDGEFLPALKQWNLNNVNYKFRPVFRFREMTPCVTAAHVPTEIWMARNFLNCGSRTLSIRDKAGYYKYDLGHFVGVYQGLFAERPELFALVDGKRIPEGFVGCWSNPEFTQYAVNRIAGIVKRGNLDLINAFPEDIRERCECPECTKNPDRSSRWYDYYKILIKEIRKQCPDVMFAGTGYAEYYQIPKTTIEGLEYVDICLNRCYVHKHDDPNCPENQKGFKHLKNWQKKTTIGLYGYEFDAIYPNPVYMPFWHMLEDQLQVCRDMNLIHVKTEQLIRWDENARREDIFNLIHRIAYYVYARLAWNPSASADAILRDFCEKVYGPAADIMYEYHDSMAKQWDSMKIHIATDTGASALPVAPAFINESIIAMAHDKFDKALKAAQGNPRVTADIELDRKLFAKWESLYLNVTANGLSICAQQMPEGNGFKDIPRQRMVDKKGQPTDSTVAVYWTNKALHIRVEGPEDNMELLKEGPKGRDVNLWHRDNKYDNVEIFIEPHDGIGYRQLAANPAGGTYDAIKWDKSWNPEWNVKTTTGKNCWTMDFTIPIDAITGSVPKHGDQWHITIIRNNQKETLAFPFASYHSSLSGAALYFSTAAKHSIVWISSKGFDRGMRCTSAIPQLVERNWKFTNVHGVEGANNVTLKGTDFIYIENYQNHFPQKFFDEKLIPAVKDGAVVFFGSYFFLDKLEKQFSDPTYAIKFTENAGKVRKPSYIRNDAFATTPNKISNHLVFTPSGTLEPKYPDKWVVLAAQKTAAGEEKPFMLARPLGKGMVVICGDILGLPLFENLLEYNKHIKR